jgi:hypothetical protein
MNPLTPKQQRAMERLMDALERAGNTHQIEDVLRALREGEARLFERDSSLIIAQVLHHPRRSVLEMWLAAGVMEDMTALLPDVEAWGRANRATLAQVIGRRGWQPAAVQHGYTPAATIYRKDI